MKKGQTLNNITVTTIGFGGVGIGVAPNGKKILIKGSVLPHSVIDCVVIQSKRDHILAMPIRVISIEDGRADETPRCPHYSDPTKTVSDDQLHKNGCGGCKRQLLSYAKQLELKVHLVHDSFRAAQYLIDEVGLEPIIPSPLTYQYRNKIEFSFGKYISKHREDKGEEKGHDEIRKDRQLGFHKQGFYTHVIDVDQCYLVSQHLHEIYHHLKTLCQDSGLPVYDSKTHQGFFRHLVLREGHNTQQVLVNLVISDHNLNTQELESQREVLRQKILSDPVLRQHITTLLITYNNELSDAVRWAEAKIETLRGPGHIFEELHFRSHYHELDEFDDQSPSESETFVIRFRVSPFSFFQTNTLGAQELFSKAASFIKLSKNKKTIMDLYCGAGTIGLSLLAQGIGNFVIGIEIVEEAIKDANYNAKINKLDTKSYFAAGKTEVLLKHDNNIASRLEDVGLVIVDPPREGLHKDVVEFLNQLKKDHKFQLIYISCNPVTLARDLDMLVQAGGRTVQTLQPVDMFPHTHHVEMISVLA